ncbi:MAG: DUF3857 domain-containing transglutaminase family protein [Rhizomicrobium sp.]
MRIRLCAVAPLLLAATPPVLAQDTASVPTPPFELVRSRVDIDVDADGSYAVADEMALRVLDSRGRKALQQTTLGYTQGLQSLQVESAYTLKANGEKIPVPPNQMLWGSGATSAPGFEDVKTLTIVFPKLEIGDEIVLITVKRQIVPLFAGEFALRDDFSRAVKTDDAQITLTAPENALPLKIEAVALDGGAREEYAGKYRWVWRFHNDAPVATALDSVVASDDQPHVTASSFPDYGAVGRAYGAHFVGKADPTPEIESLADRLTHGISDRRAQAKALYDWVSTNISYVNIVLGAGGFTPHAAADVLALRHGDCKDHVMLLEALLAAKGIASNPALIAAGGSYVLPGAPSPFYFNHLITYVPEFQLFLDSTAHYASFGVLPDGDADRPVVLVPGGKISGTPNDSADETTARAVVTYKIDPDGTAEGESHLSLTGNAAIGERAIIDSLPPDREKELLGSRLGPGAEATMDRGNLQSLSDPFIYSMHYRVPNAVNLQGPGAIPSSIPGGEFAIGALLLGALPASRQTDYACPSLSIGEADLFEFPPAVSVTFVPKSVSIRIDGAVFDMNYQIKNPHTVSGTIALRLDHPRAFCTPDYYARVRPDLARIAASLRGQILYR